MHANYYPNQLGYLVFFEFGGMHGCITEASAKMRQVGHLMVLRAHAADAMAMTPGLS